MKHAFIPGIALISLAAQPCIAAGPPPASAPALRSGNADIEAAAAKVKQALRGYGAAGKVSVTTHASTVILSGKVDSAAEARQIIQLAESAASGMRVTSELEVGPGDEAARATAADLARHVQEALKQDSATAGLPLLVSVDADRKVLLYGPVPSREARAAAGRVAARVPGVAGVDNRLVVPE